MTASLLWKLVYVVFVVAVSCIGLWLREWILIGCGFYGLIMFAVAGLVREHEQIRKQEEAKLLSIPLKDGDA